MISTNILTKKIVLAGLVSLLAVSGIAATVWFTQSDTPPASHGIKKPVVTTTTKAKAIVAETTTTIAEVTTTPTTAKATATTAKKTTTETTKPESSFSVVASASKIGEVINTGVGAQYTFLGSAHASGAGTATYKWYQHDGQYGASGTLNFGSDGNTSDVIPNHVMTVTSACDVSGWVKLKVEWDGGSAVSNHAEFYYDYSSLPPDELSGPSTGC